LSNGHAQIVAGIHDEQHRSVSRQLGQNSFIGARGRSYDSETGYTKDVGQTFSEQRNRPDQDRCERSSH
jgi:hypothetical protein